MGADQSMARPGFGQFQRTPSIPRARMAHLGMTPYRENVLAYPGTSSYYHEENNYSPHDSAAIRDTSGQEHNLVDTGKMYQRVNSSEARGWRGVGYIDNHMIRPHAYKHKVVQRHNDKLFEGRH